MLRKKSFFKEIKIYYTFRSSGNFKQYGDFMNYANHDKIDLRHFYLLITVIKTSKNSSAKHFQNKKERLQKEAGEKYQSLSKEQKEKK